MPKTALRHAARVLLIDEHDRTLLFRYGPNHRGRYFWVSPGGGLEEGESHEQAAHRELMEEVDLAGVDLGPPRWERELTYDWFDRRISQREKWYLVRCPTRPFPIEIEHLRGEGVVDARWWTLPELRATGEYLVPRQLATLVADVLAGVVPEEVTSLGP